MTKLDLLSYLLDFISPQERFAGEEEEEEESGADDSAGDDDAGGDEDKGDDDKGDDDKGDDAEDDEIDEAALEPKARTQEQKDADDAAGKDDDDEDADSDDLKVIDKRIEKKLSPLNAKIQAQNDEIEVNTYLQVNPEMSKYKAVMLKYVSHPAYKNIPIDAIASIVSAKDQQRLGAAKERAAQKKAKESRAGGSQDRGEDKGGKKDYLSMPKAEFEAEILRIKSGQGAKK